MQTITVEETALTQDTNEQEPQMDIAEPASTMQPEAPEQEITALVPAEPEVVDGEVIEIEPQESLEDNLPPKQKPYWLLIPFTVLCCLVFLAVSFLVPLLTPTATVTIIPVERSIITTAAIQVHG